MLRLWPTSSWCHQLLAQGASQVINRIRSCASRLAFKASSVAALRAIAGIVKLLLPPRQSRGISQVRPVDGALEGC
jgi:hypothetical protein